MKRQEENFFIYLLFVALSKLFQFLFYFLALKIRFNLQRQFLLSLSIQSLNLNLLFKLQAPLFFQRLSILTNDAKGDFDDYFVVCYEIIYLYSFEAKICLPFYILYSLFYVLNLDLRYHLLKIRCIFSSFTPYQNLFLHVLRFLLNFLLLFDNYQ